MKNLKIKLASKNAISKNQIVNLNSKKSGFYQIYIGTSKSNIAQDIKRYLEINEGNILSEFRFNKENIQKYLDNIITVVNTYKNQFNDKLLEELINFDDMKELTNENFKLVFIDFSQGRFILEIHFIINGVWCNWNKFTPFSKIIVGSLSTIEIDFSSKKLLLDIDIENFKNTINDSNLENTNKFIDNYMKKFSISKDDEIINESNIYKVVTSKQRDSYSQSKLRKNLLSYRKECEFCGINLEKILVASHIFSLKDINGNIYEAIAKYAYNTNDALLLCANHDKLFDLNYITVDKNYIVSATKKLDKSLYGFSCVGKKIKIDNKTDIDLFDFFLEQRNNKINSHI